ncbi:MAG: TonB-dependent receptor, partial [Acidobacteria bacterium]|nr:TonB-dependent receptor [Acidobacteriota bacterium]
IKMSSPYAGMAWLCLLLAAVSGVVLANAAGQEITGSISGVVADSSGALIPGVKVTVTNTETNVSKSVVTGASGAYRVPFLFFGTYRVTAERDGFKASRMGNVTLSTSEDVRADLTLTVGEVTEVVEVSGTAIALKTEEASVATTIVKEQLVQLPLVGRQIIGAALLAPGAYFVNNNSKAQRDSGFVRRNGLSLSVNGLTDLSNKFYYDGIEGMNFDGGTRAFDPALEAVQEVKVQVNSNSAEYGGAAGASVNIITRAGTNDFHGHVYEYLQNDKLNAFQMDAKNLRARQMAANQLVTSNKPVVRHNIFGAGAGGPIIKDKFFYFGNFEGIRGARSGRFGQRTVPTVKMRNGDFSELITPRAPVLRDPLDLEGDGNGVFNDPTNLRRFIHPTSLKVLQLVPPPTAPSLVNNFQGPFNPARIRTDEVTARLDYRLSNRDSFYGRYILNFNNDFVGDLFPLFGPGGSDRSYKRRRRNQNFSLSETHVFSSNVFNEARVGWNRSLTFEELETSFTRDVVKELGLDSQLPLSRDPLEWGPPNFSTTQSSSALGLPGLRTFAPWNPNGGQIWHFADNLSIVKGKHSLKMGGTVMRRNNVFIETLNARGDFRFGGAPGGAYTGDGLLDFMLGYMSSATVGVSPLHGRPNQFWLAGHFQDDYKVTPSLTLNLGIRYDYFQPWKELRDHWATFDLATNQMVFAKNATEAQGGRALRFGDKNNWGPRFGFAWRPLGRQNTVVRGGYGVYFEQEHPSGPILHAINPPPGGLGAAGAEFSGFGFSRDYTAPALATNPRPSLFWNNFAAGSAVIPTRVGVFAADPKMRDTYVQQWNFSVQQQFGQNSFEIGYVANKANKIFTSQNVNVPGDFASRFIRGTAALIRPEFSSIDWRMSDGSGQYHSLQTKFERRAGAALFLVSYTWGHAISDAEQGQSAVGVGGPGRFHFLSDRKLDKSSTTFDIRHRLVSSVVYEIPYRTNQAGVLGRILGGWQTNFIFTAQTGNATQVFDGTGRPDSWSRFDRPDLVADPTLPRGQRTEGRYFNTDAFQVVREPRFGTAPRMMVRQPGLWNTDFTLSKRFKVRESLTFEIRGDFYNLFNHANWRTIDTSIRDSSNPNIGPPGTLSNPYGRVNAFGEPREMQIGLKLLF